MKLSKIKIRMWQWIALAIICTATLGYFFPDQLSILLLKVTYIAIAATLGYYVDRAIFYYARPHELKAQAWVEVRGHNVESKRVEAAFRAFSLSMIRRAIVVASVVIAFALGL